MRGPVRQKIVDAIANRPNGITRDEILATVYADDIDGGPDNANVVAVLVKRANEDLAPQGFQIKPTWRGRGARYRLVSTESTAPIDEILRGFRRAQLRMAGK